MVQHLPLGGLLRWDPSTTQSRTDPDISHTILATAPPDAGTKAPWVSLEASRIAAIPPPPGAFPTSSMLQPTSPPSPPSHLNDVLQQPTLASTTIPQSRQNVSPIVLNRLPLGPPASTSLRPTNFAPNGKSTTPGPTTSNIPPSSGQGRKDRE